MAKKNSTHKAAPAKVNLDAPISIKVELSLKKALEAAANDLLPDVPGNVSVLVRRILKSFIAEHDAAKLAKFESELDK